MILSKVADTRWGRPDISQVRHGSLPSPPGRTPVSRT